MTIISRADWGARPAKSATGITGVLGVAGHWEGVKIGSCDGSQCYERVRQIQNYHMDKNGWADIAYSMVVCTCGNIFIGRGRGKRTAANGTNEANARWYAICVLMGPGDTFTEQAKRGFLTARQYLIDNGKAGDKIAPHRQFFQTQCPGDDIAQWIADGSQGVIVTNTPTPPSNLPADYFTVEAEVAVLPIVKQGVSNNQHVRILQGLLVANGRQVTIDGDFGPGTTKALKDWQSAVGLASDGVCGPVTWRRLLCI